MALTLPSSNGASSYHTARPETIQINSHFNGGLTQTTATVTPTRLKNIEDAFREHSILPPKPEKHQHMAGFATPSVNISLLMKPSANFNFANITLNQASHEASRPIEYYNNSSTNSNSNDSFVYSDEYSSEASSSAFENSRLSFSNIAEMNGNNSSSGRSKKASTATSKSRKSNQSATNMAGSSQQKTKKSTGGGRKPVRNDKLTPEEELKRAKRRERNKLAAARCRKRRLDQTNTLSEQVTDLEDKHIDLANQLNDLLAEMRAIKNSIDSHQTSFSCKNKSLTYSADLFAVLDYEAMQEAMKQIEDDDDLSELSITAPNSPAVGSRVVVKSEPPHSMVALNNISSATSVIVSNSSNLSANLMSSLANVINQQQQFQAVSSTSSASPTTSDSGTSLKRKRPNTLPVSNPYKAASVSESSTTFNSNALQTPSSGLLFGDCFENGLSTGLTPLIPSLTPSALTPSTMAAFVKSLGSPIDDSDPKKLIII